MTSNQKAFLDMLAYSEGTDRDGNGSGYDVLCGEDTFTDLSTHPALAGWRGFPLSDRMCAAAGFDPGCVSTAAGRYQINKPTFRSLARQLGINTFYPEDQDRMALELIRQCGAVEDILAGDIASAIHKCRRIWASLPGAGWGQHEHSLDRLQQAFVNAGGVLA